MGTVKRIFVEKKKEYAIKADHLLSEIKNYLGIETVTHVRILCRYDIENITEEIYKRALYIVFSEPPVDYLYEETFVWEHERVFGVELLPGQFDQRADSAMQSIKLLGEKKDTVIKSAIMYLIEGKITDKEFEMIKSYCINPVDTREAELTKPETLDISYPIPEQVEILNNFIELEKEELKDLYLSLNMAMSFEDFLHIKNYFTKSEKRNPTITEIRVLDTYWSDHCRHTTFLTELKNIELENGFYKDSIEQTLMDYYNTRSNIYSDPKKKYICLMDLALIAMKRLKKEGKLDDMEESEEINACSIVVPANVNGKIEEWLINFKNETHNHPTEIEPFGGAATCLGGAIRDPLSGRTYVYQAMRVTGAADPTLPLHETLKGKLPQKKIVTKAADGYSSYGNQIGLATGLVKEIYHPSYVAKRLEIGAVIGAAKRENVVKKSSEVSDAVILLGGRTGRDGCGGATGSSKVHTENSIETCGAEVQKGNAPMERKIQRLFRRKEVSKLIKKCNDFGAGGVAVAIGELADGLLIQLDLVKKKYDGLDGTEIAISESQERMAVVVSKEDVDTFLAYANEENLEAVKVADVIEEPRLIMVWNGREIVNISREFLNTNGAHQSRDVIIEIPAKEENYLHKITNSNIQKFVDNNNIKEAFRFLLKDLNVCSQKGLVEMFDSSIGAASVLMPFGGKYQQTETQVMAAKIPVPNGNTTTTTLMSYGFDPYLSSWSPYHGAAYAVLDSIAKIVSAGGDYKNIKFTFQEYFKQVTKDPKSFSQPFSALLGAFHAQVGFSLASIGGKDSMSGTFKDISVPPTLVSFAVNVCEQKDIISPELKAANNHILLFQMKSDKYDMPDYNYAKKMYDIIHLLIQRKMILSSYALDAKGIVPAICKMAFGNRLGVKIEETVNKELLFMPSIGSIIAEIPLEMYDDVWKILEDTKENLDVKKIGSVYEKEVFQYKEMKLTMDEALESWQETLEPVFKTKTNQNNDLLKTKLFLTGNTFVCRNKIAKPNVFIPILPGTNCEYDATYAFESVGANVTTKVFKNQNNMEIIESVEEFAKAIRESQIVMFPGGFSAGDEPEGAAKFFSAVFRNEKIKEEIHNLLQKRDGLMLGICNGFQALIKLGLLPYGEITLQKDDTPTLTYNTIGRHVSKMVYTKVVSNKSPWLLQTKPGNIYVNPASHGEGRFVAHMEWMEKLLKNGQVATQYVNLNGDVTMSEEWNINGSYMAVEGITSPDGRIFGKMAHSERFRKDIGINIYGEQDMKIFQSGVEFFK